MPPLLLDDDEAVAVAVGLRAAAASTVTGIEETSLRALTKLEQTMPARLRHRLDALRQATVSAAGGGPTVDAEMLTTIADACRDHEQLCFDYPGAHRAAVHAARAARGHRAAIRCVTSSVISRASTSRSRSWTRQNSGPCCASSPTATPQPLATRPGRRSGT
jgi:hypothetical protein